jgi:protein subunit release factor B
VKLFRESERQYWARMRKRSEPSGREPHRVPSQGDKELGAMVQNMRRALKKSPKRKPFGHSVAQRILVAQRDGETVDELEHAPPSAIETLRANQLVEHQTRQRRIRSALAAAGVEYPQRYYDEEFKMRLYFQPSELKEEMTLGRGPGGQATNRRKQTCVLAHVPTGIITRVSKFPSLYLNRKMARALLNQRLEHRLLGPLSTLGQKEAFTQASQRRKERKAKQLQATEGRARRAALDDGDRYSDFLLNALATAPSTTSAR